MTWADLETASTAGNITQGVLYVHVETPRERLVRLSNSLADIAMAFVVQESGGVVDLRALVETADLLAEYAKVAAMFESISTP